MMNEIKIPRTSLLDVVQKNRDAHEAAYTAAMTAFVPKYRDELVEMERAAADDGTYRMRVDLEKPTEHLDEYDTVLMMLRLTSSQEITLSSQEFRNVVMDEWSWSKAFEVTNSSYGVFKSK